MTKVFDEALSQSIADELASFGDGKAIPTEEPNLGTLLRGGVITPNEARSGMRRIEGALQGGAAHSGNDVGDTSPAETRADPAKSLRVVPDGYDIMPSVPGYEVLSPILSAAYQQAATGKGKERYSTGPVGFQPWHMQPILTNARQVGPGAPAFQVMKKAQESVTMAGNKNYTGAKAEALGAIIYAAALFRLYQEMEWADAVPNIG